MAWEKVVTENSRSMLRTRTRAPLASLSVSVTTGGKRRTNGERSYLLRVRIPAPMVKKSRWAVGDKVELLRDSENKNLFLMARSVFGYTLCPLEAPKGKSESLIGKSSVPVSVRFPVPDFIKEGKMPTLSCTSVTVEDEGIMFEIPAEMMK